MAARRPPRFSHKPGGPSGTTIIGISTASGRSTSTRRARRSSTPSSARSLGRSACRIISLPTANMSPAQRRSIRRTLSRWRARPRPFALLHLHKGNGRDNQIVPTHWVEGEHANLFAVRFRPRLRLSMVDRLSTTTWFRRSSCHPALSSLWRRRPSRICNTGLRSGCCPSRRTRPR